MLDERFYPAEWQGKPMLKAEDLAVVLSIHADDIYRMAKNGQIPSKKVGARRFFPTKLIVEWMETAA